MTKRLVRNARLAMSALAAAVIAACSGSSVPPPHLFVLNPSVPPPAGIKSTAGLPAIVVAQTLVPDYLDRPQIVERATANELKLIESDQWAERLSLNVSRVLAQNLAAMVPADAVVMIPAHSGIPYTYQVNLSLNSFELDQSWSAILIGRWSVADADGAHELAAATVSLREPASQPGVVAGVEAMNRNLAALSRDIAAAIKGLPTAGK